MKKWFSKPSKALCKGREFLNDPGRLRRDFLNDPGRLRREFLNDPGALGRDFLNDPGRSGFAGRGRVIECVAA